MDQEVSVIVIVRWFNFSTNLQLIFICK